jgi:hypothetical protein
MKSEFLWQKPFLALRPGDKESPQNVEKKDYRFLVGMLAAFPVLKQTRAEVGLEYFWFNQFLEDQGDQPKYPGFQDPDFREWVVAFQFSNLSSYLGYQISTQVGMSVTRRKLATEKEGETESTAFLKMMAGLD